MLLLLRARLQDKKDPEKSGDHALKKCKMSKCVERYHQTSNLSRKYFHKTFMNFKSHEFYQFYLFPTAACTARFIWRIFHFFKTPPLKPLKTFIIRYYILSCLGESIILPLSFSNFKGCLLIHKQVDQLLTKVGKNLKEVQFFCALSIKYPEQQYHGPKISWEIS